MAREGLLVWGALYAARDNDPSLGAYTDSTATRWLAVTPCKQHKQPGVGPLIAV